MLSESLIQFSVDGQDCVLSLLFDLGANYGRSNEDNGYLLSACTTGLSAQKPAAGHCQPLSPPETSGHSWASVGQPLWGHCSFLLGPGAYKVFFCVCVPSKSLFPQTCLSSGSSMVELIMTSSKRAMPYPGLLHPEPLWKATDDQNLHSGHSVTVLAQSL